MDGRPEPLVLQTALPLPELVERAGQRDLVRPLVVAIATPTGFHRTRHLERLRREFLPGPAARVHAE